jgi:alkanesulfonate monooxygenase SsuD/methylene tetrahydromethanopterin reductase-like flavin-dependent oxidoreductase (luciferase family)
VDIGISAPTGIPGASRHNVLEWARRAERRGFSTLAGVDRLNDSLDPLTSLAAIAAVTERIGLMTSVLVVPRQGNAAQLAQRVATVHRLSGGRLALGVGLGGMDDELRAAQAPMTGRGQQMAATLEQMRRIWSGTAQVGERAAGPAARREYDARWLRPGRGESTSLVAGGWAAGCAAAREHPVLRTR